MVAKTKDDMKKYVDEAVDAQRIYTEDLFSKATQRVSKVIDEQLESKLKAALAVIRPVESSSVEEFKMPVIYRHQEECLEILKRRISLAVSQYELATSLRVKHVVFGHIDGHIIARPVVSNV